jgi:hypothetical protein
MILGERLDRPVVMSKQGLLIGKLVAKVELKARNTA